MKILLAVDGSAYTKRMLACLAAHEEWLGNRHAYTVIFAVPAVPPSAAAVLEKSVLKGHYDEEADKVLRPIRKFFDQQGTVATFVAQVGPAAEHICSLAEEGDFDLLVMGSHGRGTLLNLVMGSVATQVLAGCKTPLLLVR